MINSIILDRDLLHIDSIKRYGALIPYLCIEACFTNPNQARLFLMENPIDLIFLDIEFIRKNSFLLDEVTFKKTKIIISMNSSVIEFNNRTVHAFDYIIKPLCLEKLLSSLNLIYIQKQSIQLSRLIHKKLQKQNDFFFVKTNSHIEKIKYNDVLFFKGLKDYIWIQTIEKKIITLQTMKNLCNNLPSERFIRIHKSYIVSIEHITCIERNRVLIGKEYIPIGETYRVPFFKNLKEQELLWD